MTRDIWGFVCGPGAPEGALGFVPLLLPVVLFALYAVAVLRERGRWPAHRTGFFALGCLLIAHAVSPTMLDWAAVDARGHMLQHLLLGMFAPLALILAWPGTLFLRGMPVGVARWAVRLLATPPMRAVTHPFVAGFLSVGGLYVIYLTPFGHVLAANPWGHGWLLIHFLVSGTLFAWAIAGPDPAPERPDHTVRLVALFLSAGAHGVLAARLGAFPVGMGANEVEAASWMLYFGDVGEALLALAFFHSWRTARRRRGAGRAAGFTRRGRSCPATRRSSSTPGPC